ncbi:hypothetical protein R3P38DRAFT_3231950 [Favolaschia claudopus]|uniref:Uncharacterized protein n=1 Tax=Favolaschia claudopus TaxID=2862362 RepID=A0AAV9ZJN7_9AGAR
MSSLRRVSVEEVQDESKLQPSIAELGQPFADNGLDNLDLLHEGRSARNIAKNNSRQPPSPAPCPPKTAHAAASSSNNSADSGSFVTLETNLWDENEDNRYIASIVTPIAPSTTSSSRRSSLHVICMSNPFLVPWTPPVSHLYGRPEDLVAQKPDLFSEEFMWAPDQISSAPRPSSILTPAPAAQPPPGYTYIARAPS